jgi:hypothetical protein
MKPKMTHRLTTSTPGPPTISPVSGNEVPGPPIVEYNVEARLSQSPVANVGSQVELMANQDTTISLWTVQVLPHATFSSKTSFVDDTGRKFVVVGEVANRPDRRPTFRVAAARLISDMQA